MLGPSGEAGLCAGSPQAGGTRADGSASGPHGRVFAPFVWITTPIPWTTMARCGHLGPFSADHPTTDVEHLDDPDRVKPGTLPSSTAHPPSGAGRAAFCPLSPGSHQPSRRARRRGAVHAIHTMMTVMTEREDRGKISSSEQRARRHARARRDELRDRASKSSNSLALRVPRSNWSKPT